MVVLVRIHAYVELSITTIEIVSSTSHHLIWSGAGSRRSPAPDRRKEEEDLALLREPGPTNLCVSSCLSHRRECSATPRTDYKTPVFWSALSGWASLQSLHSYKHSLNYLWREVASPKTKAAIYRYWRKYWIQHRTVVPLSSWPGNFADIHSGKYGIGSGGRRDDSSFG